MEKILVTTDLSTNSKAGLRFAIQLSLQGKFKLSFFHSYYVMKPTSWSNPAFQDYEKTTKQKIQNKLEQFVESVYKGMKIKVKKPHCVIGSSVLADSNIMEYAEENKYDYICMSTRGAGKLKKIFGTNTSNLIKHSSIPVIAVPESYRTAKITSILYASDLANVENELNKVIAFSKLLNASVNLLHFQYPLEDEQNLNLIKETTKKFSSNKIKIQLKNINLADSLISNIEQNVQKLKPSMLIMFTQQNRTFYEKLFLSSKSADYSFRLTRPLLVFNKS